MGVIVIASYRPHSGHESELDALMRDHVPILRAEGLATDRAPIAMRAGDGTVVEVFEWTSQEAIASAHTNPQVLAMWERFGAVCDYIPLAGLAEVQQMFAHFEPMNP